MALSKIDVANMLTGATPVANGGTALTSGFANGVTAAHNWRLTSVLNPSSTDTAEFFTANLEQVDTTGQGTLGTVMSQSSGVFTFPSTGIWLCGMTLYAYDNANYQYVYGEIHVTTNNSSYTEIAQSALNGEAGSAQSESSLYVQSTIDVTNTTNVKVKFGYTAATTAVNIFGDSARNGTNMIFIRLGDT